VPYPGDRRHPSRWKGGTEDGGNVTQTPCTFVEQADPAGTPADARKVTGVDPVEARAEVRRQPPHTNAMRTGRGPARSRTFAG